MRVVFVTIEPSMNLSCLGAMSFDKSTGYYKPDDGIGKTSDVVFSQYLRLTHVGAVFDNASVVTICRTT